MDLRTFAVFAALLACALPARAHAQPEALARSGPYAVDVVGEDGATLPTFEHRGRLYVLGTLGQRYLVRVRNGSPWRAEVVVSVDGRDVLDGRPASVERRGYVVAPYGEVTIDGYRLSLESVAAFRFGTVPRSYAARKGDARDVGVIGVAVFRERTPPPAPYAPPWPSDRFEDEAVPHRGGAAEAPQSGARDAAPAPAAPPGATAQAERRSLARPGLGTEFGEEHGSRAYRTTFERASARPDAVLAVRYDDRDGLLALGIDVDRAWYGRADDAWLRATAEPFRRDGAFAEPPSGWRGR